MRERTEVYVDFLQEYAAAPEVPTYEHPANCYFSAVVDSGYIRDASKILGLSQAAYKAQYGHSEAIARSILGG